MMMNGRMKKRERERVLYRKTWRSKEHTHTRAKKDRRTERITKSEKKKEKKRIIIIIYWIAIDASDFRISTQFRTTTVNRSVPSISIGGQIWFWFILFSQKFTKEWEKSKRKRWWWYCVSLYCLRARARMHWTGIHVHNTHTHAKQHTHTQQLRWWGRNNKNKKNKKKEPTALDPHGQTGGVQTCPQTR